MDAGSCIVAVRRCTETEMLEALLEHERTHEGSHERSGLAAQPKLRGAAGTPRHTATGKVPVYSVID